jgi:hypothetical protein
MDKKKNYSKKAGGKGLMAAIADYQKEKKSGPQRPGAVKGQGPVADSDKYGKLLKKNKKEDSRGPVGVRAPKAQTPPKRQTPPKKDPPKSNGTTGSNLPSNPQLKTQKGKGGTYGRSMPSNPQVGYSKPVRKNFSSQKAFLAALETYMRRKNRGTDAARSTGKNKAKQATDGRQYGG